MMANVYAGRYAGNQHVYSALKFMKLKNIYVGCVLQFDGFQIEITEDPTYCEAYGLFHVGNCKITFDKGMTYREEMNLLCNSGWSIG